MMNCATARRYLYAFADGELPVKENCEVIDHLKMCPECTRIATEQQELRLALRRSLNVVPMPDGLSDRVAASINGRSESAVGPPPPGGTRRRRMFVPMAAAASVLLAATTYWMIPRAPDESSAVRPARLPEGGDEAVQLVVQMHEQCAADGPEHQDPGLPHDLNNLPMAISKHFGDVLDVLVPDFNPFGFAFESAGFCGFTKTRGAHLVYASSDADPQRLSFFILPRWSAIDDCGYYKGVGDEFLRKFGFPHGNPKYTIEAWHDNQTTYICCGRVGVERMAKMLEPIRATKQRPAER